MTVFGTDTFAGTLDTDITAHTADDSGTWVYGTSEAAAIKLDAAGRLYCGSALGTPYHSGAPATAEYDVQVDLVLLSNTTASCGVTGRQSTSAQTYYFADYYDGGNTYRLYKMVAGSATSLGSYALSEGAGTKVLKLAVRDATKKVYVDSVERISSTDNAITAAGKAGVRMSGNGGGQTTTAGLHLDNFSATDAAAPTYTGTAAVAVPHLTASGTGTFVAPVYTGSAAITLPKITVGGTGTFVVPTYTGAAAIALPRIAAAGNPGALLAESGDTLLTENGDTLTLEQGSGSGTFTTPTYTGAAALALPAPTVGAAGTFATPTYTGAAALALPALAAAGNPGALLTEGGDRLLVEIGHTLTLEQGSASGTFAAPTYTGAATIALPALTATATGNATAPVYSGSAAIGLPALAVVAVGASAAPTYTGTGAASLPALAVVGVGTSVTPTYTGAAAAALAPLVASGAGTLGVHQVPGRVTLLATVIGGATVGAARVGGTLVITTEE